MVQKRPAARALSSTAVTGSPIRVAASRTGLPEETLRAWERRYGYPAPQRRSGGSRVYSEADIDKLQVLAKAIGAGFRPGDVVQLPVDELRRLLESATRDAGAHTTSAIPDTSEERVRLVLDALERDDARGVREALHAMAVQLGARAFVTECAHPLIVRVGIAWAEGLLDVRHEHLASAYLQTQLRSMLADFVEPANAKIVVLTTLPEEPHTLPLDLVAVYLTSLGVSPRLLGASTPADQIAAAALALHADAVGISVSAAAPRTRTQHELNALRAALAPGVPLWVGGSGARTLSPAVLRVTVVDSWSRIDDAVRILP